MTSAKSLYLPVEGLARELDGKLLLALIARERGWRPVIGYKRAIRDRGPMLPPGVLLSHNARLRKPRMFARMATYGHRTVVLDEEALVRQTDEIFLLKHDPKAFDSVDLVLSWGQDDADLWSGSALVEGEKVRVTGNPRMDMLRPELASFREQEVAEIRERFGDYVLFNSNFPTVNHFVPTRTTLTFADAAEAQYVDGPKSAFLNHKRQIFERFLTLIPKIAEEIAPTKLIVRPHPSENHDAWHRAVAGASNASVVSEGSVVPWLAGARALVHNGCTSAVEAAVLGATVLSYRPVQSPELDNPLPNGVGIECFDDDTLLAELRKILDGGPRQLSNSQQQLLERHVAAMSGAFACERILDALDELPNSPSPAIKRGLAVRFKQHIRLIEKVYLKQLKKQLSQGGRLRLAYIDRKMSQMTPDNMNRRIDRLRRTLGRFEACRAKPLAKNLFVIE